jgi:hypothetical protein
LGKALAGAQELGQEEGENAHEMKPGRRFLPLVMWRNVI